MTTPKLITVTGTLFNVEGEPTTGTVKFTSPVNVSHNSSDDLMVASPITGVAGVDGELSVAVPSSNDPAWSPSSWTWQVKLKTEDHTLVWNAVVPYDAPSSTIRLNELVPVPLSNGALYALLNHTHSDLVTEDELDTALAGVGGGGGAVASVNGKTGVVVLNSADIGAQPSGSYAASTHTHIIANVTGLQNALDNKQPAGDYVEVEVLNDMDLISNETLQESLTLKAPVASPTFTGTAAAPTPTALDSSTKIATTAFVQGELTNKAPLNSPAFTGTPTAPTQVADESSTRLATTAYVQGELTDRLVTSQANLDLVYGVTVPTDYGLSGWTYVPVNHQGGLLLPTAGLLFTARIRVMRSTITNIHFHVQTPGATLTTGQCFAMVYADGVGGGLLGTSADTSGTGANGWQTGGYKVHPLTAPITGLTPYTTWVRVAWYANGTTLPTFTRGVNSSSAALNLGLASNFMFATANTGLTTTPPSTVGTLTGGATGWWVGVS